MGQQLIQIYNLMGNYNIRVHFKSVRDHYIKYFSCNKLKNIIIIKRININFRFITNFIYWKIKYLYHFFYLFL